MPYSVTMFGATVLSAYAEAGMQQAIGTGQAQHGYLQMTDGTYMDQYGAYERLPSTLQPISKSMLVVEDTAAALQATLATLRAMLGTRDRLVIDWRGTVIIWQWARCIQVDIPAEFNQLTHAVVNMAWVTSDPHWHGTVNGDAWEWDDDTLFWDSGVAEWDSTDQTYTLDGSPVSIELANDGNLLQRDLRVQVDVPSGGDPITAIAVANATAGNNTLWSYAGGTSIGLGERLYVDSGERRAVHMAAAKSVTGITQSGRTTTVTVTSHGYVVGDTVYMDPNDGDLTLANAGFFEITAKDTNTFSFVNYRGVAETPTGAKARKVTNVRTYLTPSRIREWLSLSPGDNDLSVTYTGNSTNDATVSFDWSDRHA